MSVELNVAERLAAGQEVEIAEIEARINELDAQFEERGFVYIAVNGWLVPALDGDRDARELMCLEAVAAKLDGHSEGRVVVESRDEPEGATYVCRLNERYAPDGHLYVLPECKAAPGV